jgi:hypothetical protein
MGKYFKLITANNLKIETTTCCRAPITPQFMTDGS